MIEHLDHQMHENSLENDSIDDKPRKEQIAHLLDAVSNPPTDCEVAEMLVSMGLLANTEAVNSYRPAISQLIREGSVVEVKGGPRCRVKGRHLRRLWPAGQVSAIPAGYEVMFRSKHRIDMLKSLLTEISMAITLADAKALADDAMDLIKGAKQC
jgi:hypothetical protein